MSEVNPVLDEFFPILIENFIRFETASLYVRSREAGAEVPPAAKFKIAPEYYPPPAPPAPPAPPPPPPLPPPPAPLPPPPESVLRRGLVNLDGRTDALFYGTLRKQDYERRCP